LIESRPAAVPALARGRRHKSFISKRSSRGAAVAPGLRKAREWKGRVGGQKLNDQSTLYTKGGAARRHFEKTDRFHAVSSSPRASAIRGHDAALVNHPNSEAQRHEE
jgi:hypothetical protein